MRTLRLFFLAAIAIVVAAAAWLTAQRLSAATGNDSLYGNVDIRQVDLAFNAEGTVLTLGRHEGDLVRKGDLLAELEVDTYRDARALAQGRRDAAKAQLDELLAGTRPEDIDEARANTAAAEAEVVHADALFQRQAELVRTSAISRQTYDDARMGLDTARARVAQTHAVLAKALAGPRIEDIDAARGQLGAAEATLKLADDQLAHTHLVAPSDGVIMTRVVEPGTVVLPTAAVYSMAITGEVWVRAFAPEPLLGRVAPGSAVAVLTDAGGHAYHGHVGYVSPVAEFTPKTVETPELRTQLVYRLRIRIDDPDDALRQGMPVTIRLARGD
jgi:HlyD family secretion protein